MAQRVGGRRRTTSAGLESSFLPLPQHGCRHAKQSAPAPAARTEITQWRGGRRRTSGTTASATLDSDFIPLRPAAVLEGLLLKLPHIDGCEMSRTLRNIRPLSSSPDNKIIHNTGPESLHQLLYMYIIRV